MTAGATLPPDLPEPGELDERARALLARHWHDVAPDGPAWAASPRDPGTLVGYTVPHAGTYPFQWLWDSCFHAVAWAHLGEADRAVAELAHLFRAQDEAGFVPHVDYEADPEVLAGFWGRPGSSSITQPPMFGHALAELDRRGVDVPAELAERATRGLRFLLGARARDRASELLTLVHPWESGADDSPRWDDWCPGGFDPSRWYGVKGDLLATVARGRTGAPLANRAFAPAPAGFNALVAFNAAELAGLTGDDRLRDEGRALAEALGERWDRDRATWVDAGPAQRGSGAVRTLDGLLPALVDPARAPGALADALDPATYGGPCGPAGVHRDEPAFAPRAYWRGPAWPQLTYLLWVAATRAGRGDHAAHLAACLVRGATASGWAEYWDPDDGRGLGAVPQSWAALAAVVAGAPAGPATGPA